MAEKDPFTGPMQRDQFMALVDAPHGTALKALRKHDPMVGRAPGEKIDWEVTFSGTVFGSATVRAASLDEAKKLAKDIKESEIEWDKIYAPVEDVEIDSVVADA